MIKFGERPELLSPAGNYETMLAAFAAGADAVYLGGQSFGARAYADNFGEEQVVRAIQYAHLHDKKIYLTVNTLIKEKEYDSLYSFLKPYAEVGLDGVIVQDLAAWSLIGSEFPKVELHGSTQMAVTGVYGAKMLKKMGATRVVPARELSLEEMKKIRTEADIEVEAFIHGAMCYSYSGMCLFSSMLGGRSGNRGRCAQPCRLPYQYKNGKECYPLSLRDMCSIELLPELIRSGISSFKIEGRMKAPEYAAGVTAIYRKYMDLYLEHPDQHFRVTEEDINDLHHLYLRTGISQGYYYKHNGKEMITLDSPSYNGNDEALLQEIRSNYVTGEDHVIVDMFLYLSVGEPAMLTVIHGEKAVTVTGEIVQYAQKRSVTEEEIRSRISKMGNTLFTAGNVEIEMPQDEIFLSVGGINALRRMGLEELGKQI